MKSMFVIQILLSFHLNVLAISNITVSNEKQVEITNPLQSTCSNLLCKSTEKNCCIGLYCCEDLTAKSNECSQGNICIGSKLPDSGTGGIETCCLEEQCCRDKGDKEKTNLQKGFGIIWWIILPTIILLICCGFFCFEFYMTAYQSSSFNSSSKKFYRLRLLQRRNAENRNLDNPVLSLNQQELQKFNNNQPITGNNSYVGEDSTKVNKLNENQ